MTNPIITQERLIQSFDRALASAMKLSRCEFGCAVYVVPEVQVFGGLPQIVSFGFTREYGPNILARAENNVLTVS